MPARFTLPAALRLQRHLLRCLDLRLGLALLATAAGLALPPPVEAAAARPGAKPRPAARAPARRAPRLPALPAASEAQREAAELVYYGHYDCEFDQHVDIARDAAHEAYVEVSHARSLYRMRPVLSTTGAVRLEDVAGRTLMVQIAQKSMLMDVKAGRRLVDACISPTQRAAAEAAERQRIEAERAAQAQADREAAARAAESGPPGAASTGVPGGASGAVSGAVPGGVPGAEGKAAAVEPATAPPDAATAGRAQPAAEPATPAAPADARAAGER